MIIVAGMGTIGPPSALLGDDHCFVTSFGVASNSAAKR